MQANMVMDLRLFRMSSGNLLNRLKSRWLKWMQSCKHQMNYRMEKSPCVGRAFSHLNILKNFSYSHLTLGSVLSIIRLMFARCR